MGGPRGCVGWRDWDLAGALVRFNMWVRTTGCVTCLAGFIGCVGGMHKKLGLVLGMMGIDL
jgi:hypothetical protein